MARDWDYAKLSKLAKQNGGPKALLDKIFYTNALKFFDKTEDMI